MRVDPTSDASMIEDDLSRTRRLNERLSSRCRFGAPVRLVGTADASEPRCLRWRFDLDCISRPCQQNNIYSHALVAAFLCHALALQSLQSVEAKLFKKQKSKTFYKRQTSKRACVRCFSFKRCPGIRSVLIPLMR